MSLWSSSKLEDAERAGLKAVVRTAVVEAGGQENCGAAVSGRITRAAAYSDYANPAQAERHIPLDVAVELDRFNRNGRVLAAAARLAGYQLQPLPSLRAHHSTAESLSRVAKEGGEAIGALASVMDGGRAPAEAVIREAIRQIDESIEAQLEARARLEALLGARDGEDGT